MADEVTAALVIIGNEVLSGRTQDKNIGFIATGLNDVGVRLREVRIVPDIEQAIIKAVNELRVSYTYVFTTGGIGPTHDDITAKAIANAFAVPLILDQRALDCLSKVIRPEDMNDARLRMAHLPVGAELIENKVSQAPGFRIGNVYVMAGVPKIMQAMFDSLRSRLVGGLPMLSRSITVFIREGSIAAELAGIQNDFPDDDIGSYPFHLGDIFGTVIVSRSTRFSNLEAIGTRIFALAEKKQVKAMEGDQSPTT